MKFLSYLSPFLKDGFLCSFISLVADKLYRKKTVYIQQSGNFIGHFAQYSIVNCDCDVNNKPPSFPETFLKQR